MTVVAIAVALVAAFVAVRLVALDADPPWPLPNGQSGQELVVEGPAKAHEARKWALFGQFDTDPADEYRFWRAQSPAYVYPLAWWLATVGVGWAQLKIFGALATTLGLFGVLWLSLRRHGAVAMTAAGVLLGANFYAMHYSRAGLLEPYLNMLAVGVVAAGLAARRDLRWSVLMHWVLLAALLTKLSAAYLVPVVVTLTVLAHRSAAGRDTPRWQHAVVLGHGIAVAAGLSIYMLSEPYWRTVEWNYVHMVHDGSGFGDPRMSGIAIGDVLGRLFDLDRLGPGFAQLFPVALPLALLRLVVTVVQVVRRHVEAYDAVLVLWLMSAFALLQLTPLVLVRFTIIVVPPLVLLAAGGVALIMDRLRSRRWAQWAVGGAIVLALAATHGRWQSQWLGNRTTQIRANNEAMAKAVQGQRATIVGHYGAAMTFGTTADYFYVKKHFNLSKETLSVLPFTHVFSRLGKRDSVRRRVPWRFVGAKEVARAQFRERNWALLRLDPDRSPQSP